MWQYVTFSWNLFLVGYPKDRAFSHVWSLCVEEHSYLLLPALVLWRMQRPNIRTTAALLVAIVIGGMLLRGGLLFHVVRGSGTEDDEEWIALMRYIYYPIYSRLEQLS